MTLVNLRLHTLACITLESEMFIHVKVIIGGQHITLEILRFHTNTFENIRYEETSYFSCKSDNWRSVENMTLECM